MVEFDLELWSNDEFNYEDFNYGSCPLLIESTMFLFGGASPQQIIEVYPLGSLIFRRILDLPFDFVWGSCAYHSGVVYLCFGKIFIDDLCQSR